MAVLAQARWQMTRKQIAKKIGAVARNPVVRPIEVWAIRAALAYLTVKLGIKADHLAK